MSFRELRSFAETMRMLGYPRTISMESFRTPNVELTADCVYWLVKRYEPSAEIAFEIEREADRVFFFRQICQSVLAKGRIRLNIKKLYQANGHAVQEMLKLANILKQAMYARVADEPDFAALQTMAAQKSMQSSNDVRKLCSDLTHDGSTLFFLVEEEIQNRLGRARVMSRATEVGEFERRLRDLLSEMTQQVSTLQQSYSSLTADEANLEQKIENKKMQLERAQKRLKSLLAVRPAFMEEYEKHESELHAQFVIYLEQYRNLEYLEHELTRFIASEDAVLAEQERKLRIMRERQRKDELAALHGESRGVRGRSGDGGRQLDHKRRSGGVRGRDEEGEPDDMSNDDDGDEGYGKRRRWMRSSDQRHDGRAGARRGSSTVRNAAVEGSSRSDSGDSDVSSDSQSTDDNYDNKFSAGPMGRGGRMGNRRSGGNDDDAETSNINQGSRARPQAAMDRRKDEGGMHGNGRGSTHDEAGSNAHGGLESLMGNGAYHGSGVGRRHPRVSAGGAYGSSDDDNESSSITTDTDVSLDDDMDDTSTASSI